MKFLTLNLIYCFQPTYVMKRDLKNLADDIKFEPKLALTEEMMGLTLSKVIYKSKDILKVWNARLRNWK